MINNPAVGQRVRLATTFLRSTRQSDYEAASRRGTVTKVDYPCGGHFYIKILWDGDSTEKGCLSCNVERADAPCLD